MQTTKTNPTTTKAAIERDKMLHRKNIIHLIVTALLVLLPAMGMAQELYTLSNGSLWWFEGNRTSGQRVPIAFDEGNHYAEVHPYNASLVTELTEIGNTFLALDTTGGTPHIVTLDTTGFSPLCVWKRTGTTGYYYQEHGSKRYYLIGSSNEGLSIYAVEIGYPVNKITTWYDWDFGAAVTEVITVDGRNKERYHWIYLDAESGEWGMSCNSYERPEDIIYANWGGGDNVNFRYYCSREVPSGGGTDIVKAGNGALYMPVSMILHPKKIDDPTGGTGLTGSTTSVSTIRYGETSQVSPIMNLSEGHNVANIMPEYVEYRFETFREGINTRYKERTTDAWGSKGVAQSTTSYFTADNSTRLHQPPASRTETLEVKSIDYTMDNASRRYISLQKVSDGCIVKSINVPDNDHLAKIITIVEYTNGMIQTDTAVITVSSHVEPTVHNAVNAPVVRGSVFGGGRMADVAQNTTVTIHNTDTIASVFGGNDISGRVRGDIGSTVNIGSTQTTSGIAIGSVYGGGNGYYNYDGVDEGPEQERQFTGGVKTMDGAEVTSDAGTAYIPDIKATHVNIANVDDPTISISIDEVFGGAKNAFISTEAGEEAITIRVEGGTIYSLYGGNNLGGKITEGSKLDIQISNTSTSNDTNITNSYFHGFGRDFGIRYLFGGGNKVPAPKVNMTINGGMVDTAFAGGNNASVEATLCRVETGSGASKIYHNLTTASPKTFVGGRGRYNVRCLFGGNNYEAMTILPTLELVSGGIGTVYGGGNAGDMNCSNDVEAAMAALFDKANTGIVEPTKIGTQVLVQSDDIEIDYLYGGCRMANVLHSTFVDIKAGKIGTVFGGCNISGDVGSTDNTNRNGTYVVMEGGLVYANLFAGANGEYHCTDPSDPAVYGDGINFTDNSDELFDTYDEYFHKLIPTHNRTNLLLTGGTVNGNVYGGANLANVGFKDINFKLSKRTDGVQTTITLPAQQNRGAVHLTMTGGRVKNNLFGGGNMASIYGLSNLRIMGDTPDIDGSLFAGNDRAGSIMAWGVYTDYQGDTIQASDGSELYSNDNASYSTYVLLEGKPKISKVYGGGNGAYNYDGTRQEYGEQILLCSNDEKNRPIQPSSFIDIHTDYDENRRIDTVFGGGNGVYVQNGVKVLLNTNTTDAQLAADAKEMVGTIFGGNNRDSMATCVPIVTLTRGKVENVYGGSNAGDMSGQLPITDACGKELNVTTYILVNSDKVTITGDLYGGCNRANVDGLAYIDIRQTSADGIKTVYGGNNVSGRVSGTTRIDMRGGVVHNIYGGSNGYYDYKEYGHEDFMVYEYGHIDDANALVATHTSGRPIVDTTYVNIYGGTLNSSVFGGGRMGNCVKTTVLVNDQTCGAEPAYINGVVYGGGEGDTANLNNPRLGNVTQETNVILRHATQLTGARAYGGGKGGDVADTYITTYPTWEHPFEAIYGGCWGSDVVGVAHLRLNGRNESDKMTAYNVYGGNDFTGNVYKSEVVVNSGRYQNIYGAGNGNYAESLYTTGVYSGIENNLTVPNNEYVVLTVNDGYVDSTVYGGGMLGTTMAYKKDAEGYYLYDTYGHKIANIDHTQANAETDPEKYAYIIVNIHGGTFAHDIFAGARGVNKQLVYGLKVLNMDNGEVTESVYGGSRYVDDGYPKECVSATNTTKRPSSIVNIAGGQIQGNVFGGGYMGNIHGSAYVNIGIDAITNSIVWTSTYNGQAQAYHAFNPSENNFENALSSNRSHLYVYTSVYGGADWGRNTGGFDFRKPGFFGGESRILLDGNKYNTFGPYGNASLKQMDIGNSIIGSGTSVQGGDILNRIDVQNYGIVDTTTCRAYKTLRSIQRADVLWLHNTAINYTGSSDAVTAYTSQEYTINRIKRINVRGYNVIDVDAIIDEVDTLNFYEDALDAAGQPVLTTIHDLYRVDATQCQSNPTVCKQLSMIDPTDRKYAALVVYNGVNIRIKSEEKGYGHVFGHGYLLAENGTNAVVEAAPKYFGHNMDDGGFMATCSDSNKVITMSGGDNNESLVWGACTSDNCDETAEFVYHNYNISHRVWSVGYGRRTRFAVILAHSNPDSLAENKTIWVDETGGATDYKLSLAHAELILPPTSPGHYYTLAPSGILIRDDNSTMKLVDKTWLPKHWSSKGVDANGNPVVYTDSIRNDEWQTKEVSGDWLKLAMRAGSTDADLMTAADIVKNPATTFGLVIASGNNFKRDGDGYKRPQASTISEANWNNGLTAISGNTHVNIISNFASAVVSDSVHASPVMDLYLTYDNNFANSMLGTVYFSLIEHDSLGNDIHAPVDVAITVATIVEKFRPMEFDLLAMYNEGRTDSYTRKAVFPATLQHREIYLDSVIWYPDEGALNDFLLTGGKESVMSHPDPKAFSISIEPVDNVSSTITSTVGWDMISIGETDIYSQFYNSDTYSAISGTGSTAEKLHLNNSDDGLLLGALDGRGLSALDIKLTFNGNKIFPDKYVGHMVLHLKSKLNAADTNADRFTIKLNIKCRDHGDTIYIASANTISRAGQLLRCDSLSSTGDPRTLGKVPSRYLRSFQEALSSKIYQEGDVIAILDTVIIEDGGSVTINGSDYEPLPVIRYAGHHHELPGEAGVYRGTMIKVKGDSTSFTARNIAFNGSSVSKITLHSSDTRNVTVHKDYYNPMQLVPGTDPYRVLDTNVAYGPIIAVLDSAEVVIETGTLVENNYNAANDPQFPEGMGAISITKNGQLSLKNDVIVRNNIEPAPSSAIGHPTNGAIYINQGTLYLDESSKGTAINITQNYLMPTTPITYWTDHTEKYNNVDQLVRYDIDTDAFTGTTPGNVFLTRTALEQPDDEINDKITNVIQFQYEIIAGTRIGVSKWFPGETIRDTIRFAYQPQGRLTAIEKAFKNQNFVSDEEFNILYEYDINNQTMFLHRCATFRQQLANQVLPYGNITTGDALEYKPLNEASCPTGGDTVVYRVQGGFFPYTYTWVGNENSQNRITEGTSTSITKEIEENNFDNYKHALTDTLYTPKIEMGHSDHEKLLTYTVTATDASKFCTLTKNIEVTIRKNTEESQEKFKKLPTESAWTNLDAANTIGETAKGERNFKAIKITPRAWVDRTSGTITAKLPYDPIVYKQGDDESINRIDDLLFCEGDVIKLAAIPTYQNTNEETTEFLMWDFDPFYTNPAQFVVPSHNTDVVAYFGPLDYWIDTITNATIANAVYDDNYDLRRDNNESYITTYDGDVHIYDEKGLAWFISVVNGLNGMQARAFYFNNVYIHQKSTGDGSYDMHRHKWTPIGSYQNNFRGRFIGVDAMATSTTPLPIDERVVIKNIIVNEKDMPYAGLFGNIDAARISGIELRSEFVRGGQYVGGIAANSVDSRIQNTAVKDSIEDVQSTTILTTRHTSGGLIGKSMRDTITNSVAQAKYVGDAVYSGGIIGYGYSSQINNTHARNLNRMVGVYLGGLAGYLNGEAPVNHTPLFRSKSGGHPSMVTNNYVHIITEGRTQNVGGLVGYAEQTVMENNYVYGEMEATGVEGAIGSIINDGTTLSNNYYEQGVSNSSIGRAARGISQNSLSKFDGKGNAISLQQPVYGINNLTRALNIWVNEQNAAAGLQVYNTWRSSLDGRNNGYPTFGVPDLIPVHDTSTISGCEYVYWNNQTFTHDSVIAVHIVDSMLMIDSISEMYIYVHHGTITTLSDSIEAGNEYYGYGFHVSATETALVQSTIDSLGYATIMLYDTLPATNGCDSIVALMLTVSGTQSIPEIIKTTSIKIYPNPTTSIVNIDASDMSHIELYDNEGRRLSDHIANTAEHASIDLSTLSSGIYYLRIHSSTQGTTIHKVVKK